MAKRSRDGNDVVLPNGLSIKIIDAEISKNKKLYYKLPDTLQRLPPPAQSSDLWFNFGKQWHPVGLFDVDGKLVISKNSLTMEISNIPPQKENIKQTPYSVSAMATKGVYWFAVISVFVGGIITYKFTSSDADSLFHRTEIIGSEISDSSRSKAEASNAALPKKTSSTPSSTKEKQKKASSEIAKETDTKSCNLDKSKKSRSAIASKQEDSKAKRILTSMDLASACGVSGSNRLNGIGRQGSPVPGGGLKLSYKSRIERSAQLITPKVNEDMDHKFSAQSLVRVRGPILEIALPPSLTVALLDDRARIDSGITGVYNLPYSSVSTETDSSSSSSSQTMAPSTVADLLNKIQLRAKHSIAECDVLILRLRQLFECLFESSILYSIERKEMKQEIEAIKAQKSSFADSYGGIYLLRLIVLIVAGADSIYPTSKESAGSGLTDVAEESSSSSTERSKTGNLLYDPIDNDHVLSTSSHSSPHNISQNSKSRRSAIINKHQKNEFYKFQELIDCVLKELDESAHIIF